MLSQQQRIEQLNRKVALLDQYALTLEKQNLAKNNQTETLYTQLTEVRMENDILRSHLSRINLENIERIRKQHTQKQIEIQTNSVNSSVQFQQKVNLQTSNQTQKQKQDQSVDLQITVEQSSVFCQTQQPFSQPQTDPNVIHQHCTEQISKLLYTVTEKQQKISATVTESQQMYETILHLEEENQNMRKSVKQTEMKFKTFSKQNKAYQIEIQELRNVIHQERQAFDQESNSLHSQRDNNTAAEHQIQRLIKENNRLIERIRMLEKEKNSFYSELRGKNVSPLKTSQISSRQNMPQNMVHNLQIQSKLSFVGGSTSPYSSEQKSQPQRFSSQFTIGKKKQKLKAERWRKIQDKINQVKEQNQQIRANLSMI